MTKTGGWTLLEMLVVIVIVAIVGGRAVLSLGISGGAALRREAERLAGLIDGARNEAVLESRVIILRLSESGYDFEDADGRPLAGQGGVDDLFRARAFPAGVKIVEAHTEERLGDGNWGLRFTPWGETSDFDLKLSDGRHRAEVRGEGLETDVESPGA